MREDSKSFILRALKAAEGAVGGRAYRKAGGGRQKRWV